MTVEITATRPEKMIENSKQITEIPNYGVLDSKTGNWKPYPFIYPLFRQNEIANLGIFVDKDHADPSYEKGIVFYAHDLWFGKNGKAGVNIYMPFSFTTNWIGHDVDTTFWRIIVTSKYTGYLCYLEHLNVSEKTVIPINANKSPDEVNASKDWSIDYDPNIPLAQIGAPEKNMTLPHLHLECQNPLKPLVTDDIKYVEDQNEIWKGLQFARVYRLEDLPA